MVGGRWGACAHACGEDPEYRRVHGLERRRCQRGPAPTEAPREDVVRVGWMEVGVEGGEDDEDEDGNGNGWSCLSAHLRDALRVERSSGTSFTSAR